MADDKSCNSTDRHETWYERTEGLCSIQIPLNSGTLEGKMVGLSRGASAKYAKIGSFEFGINLVDRCATVTCPDKDMRVIENGCGKLEEWKWFGPEIQNLSTAKVFGLAWLFLKVEDHSSYAIETFYDRPRADQHLVRLRRSAEEVPGLEMCLAVDDVPERTTPAIDWAMDVTTADDYHRTDAEGRARNEVLRKLDNLLLQIIEAG